MIPIILERDLMRADVVTHGIVWHADNAASLWLASKIVKRKEIHVYITRDPKILNWLETFDERVRPFVLDISGHYEPERKIIDHHGQDFNERCYGTLCSTAGLLWKLYGEYILEGYAPNMNKDQIRSAHKTVYDRIIRDVDLHDNGRSTASASRLPNTIESLNILSQRSSLGILVPGGYKPEDVYTSMYECAGRLIEAEILRALSVEVLKKQLVTRYRGYRGVTSVVIEEYYEYVMDAIVALRRYRFVRDLCHVVCPIPDGSGWYVWCVPLDKKHMMSQKLPFPMEWRGKRGEELKNLCGVPNAYVAPGGFIATTLTCGDAEMLASAAYSWYWLDCT